jgi:hypothetical protein
VRNLRAEPSVRVRVGDAERNASARVVEDPDEASTALSFVVEEYCSREDGLDEWAAAACPVALE